MEVLKYEGSRYFKERLTLSVLSGKGLEIREIRSKLEGEERGISLYEKSLLDLVIKVTNGTSCRISETGCSVRFMPGMLIGGTLLHDCDPERGIGYYLEMLMCFAPFCKNKIKAILRGVTNGTSDPSVDMLKATAVPLLKNFMYRDEVEIQIKHRGVPPLGGGEVTFFSTTVKKLRLEKPLLQQGKIKRIRGTAFSARVAPQMSNRMVTSARGILNQFVRDIFIKTDHRKGRSAGNSPGFGICLVAETTEGVTFAVEANSTAKGGDPEDIGKEAAFLLLEEIGKGGCMNSSVQHMAQLMMILGEQNVIKSLSGPLTDYSMEWLRLIKDFFGILFKFDRDQADHDVKGNKMGSYKVQLTCVGLGYTNMAKSTI